MATHYSTTGKVIEVLPNNGKTFTYEELQHLVSAVTDDPDYLSNVGRTMIEIVPLPSGKSIVVNEEGKLIGLPYNAEASKAWNEEYPIDQYPQNNDQTIVGNALIATETELREEE